MLISGVSLKVIKSFISLNLAAVISKAGQKVLVIVGDITYIQAIKETSVENLSSASRGQISPHSSELLTSKHYSAYIKYASKNYDLVLIVTPSILAITDAGNY